MGLGEIPILLVVFWVQTQPFSLSKRGQAGWRTQDPEGMTPDGQGEACPILHSMGEHLLRQVGPGNHIWRLFDRVSQHPNIEIPVIPAQHLHREASNSSESHSTSSQHSGNQASPFPTKTPRGLFYIFHGTQEKQELQISPGFEIREQVYTPSALSYGVSENHCGSTSTRGVPHFPGPDGGVPSCVDSPRTLQIPSFLCGQQAFPVQGNAIRPLHSTTGVHETPGNPCGISQTAGHSCPSISGRSFDSVTVLCSGATGHRHSDQVPHGSRISLQQGQESSHPLTATHASWDGARHQGHDGIPHGGESTKDTGLGGFSDNSLPFIPTNTHSIAGPPSGQHGWPTLGTVSY